MISRDLHNLHSAMVVFTRTCNNTRSEEHHRHWVNHAMLTQHWRCKSRPSERETRKHVSTNHLGAASIAFVTYILSQTIPAETQEIARWNVSQSFPSEHSIIVTYRLCRPIPSIRALSDENRKVHVSQSFPKHSMFRKRHLPTTKPHPCCIRAIIDTICNMHVSLLVPWPHHQHHSLLTCYPPASTVHPSNNRLKTQKPCQPNRSLSALYHMQLTGCPDQIPPEQYAIRLCKNTCQSTRSLSAYFICVTHRLSSPIDNPSKQ